MELLACDRLFEEAFGGTSESPQLCEESEYDRVVITPGGLRLDYSRHTADWLAQVAGQPAFLPHRLVCDRLAQMLGSHGQPLGKLLADFAALHLKLFGDEDAAEDLGGSLQACIPIRRP